MSFSLSPQWGPGTTGVEIGDLKMLHLSAFLAVALAARSERRSRHQPARAQASLRWPGLFFAELGVVPSLVPSPEADDNCFAEGGHVEPLTEEAGGYEEIIGPAVVDHAVRPVRLERGRGVLEGRDRLPRQPGPPLSRGTSCRWRGSAGRSNRTRSVPASAPCLPRPARRARPRCAPPSSLLPSGGDPASRARPGACRGPARSSRRMYSRNMSVRVQRFAPETLL